MKIATIGRGTIGGTLARLWRSAGHEVTELGRDGGDVAGAEVVLVAVPYGAVPDALAGITGLDDQVVIDATNRLGGEDPPSGYASVSDYVKANTTGPVAKAFNLNFGGLFDRIDVPSAPPQVIWAGDDGARAVLEQLTRDIGMQAVNGGSLEQAATQEAFAFMLMAIVKDAGGLVFYRFGTPEEI